MLQENEGLLTSDPPAMNQADLSRCRPPLVSMKHMHFEKQTPQHESIHSQHVPSTTTVMV